ncbi:MAG: alkaline phosphatase family protein [Candidatus Binataceae bacterium]
MKALRTTAVILGVVSLLGVAQARVASTNTHGRIFVLMVWDGLRPDFVTRDWTPSLYQLEHAGVEFAHQHAIFPTMTIANAAALATGTGPGGNGIYADDVYFAPLLRARRLASGGLLMDENVKLESSRTLAALNGTRAFDGRLLGLETIAQRIEHSGGYLAIIGKAGPTFLFDDAVAEPARAGGHNYLFVADDLSEPSSLKLPPEQPSKLNWKNWHSVAARDAWFTDLVISRALPSAKAQAIQDKNALIVFWQHDPDLVQHAAGLGTSPALHALAACDHNLARIRAAIKAYGIAGRTDLMVVSDHGFSTIRANVTLADLLVAAGLKQSQDSDDLVISRDGGADLLYLSHARFKTRQQRRDILQRVVDYAEAQPWCGPIFSKAGNGNGAIAGSFGQRLLGLYNPARSPDLIISFRAFPDQSNQGLTGPHNPGVTIGGKYASRHGPNESSTLVHPVEGVIYSDSADLMDPHKGFTTGMGMHGAAGERDLHNFCAAYGPDFREGFVDQEPSGNTDIAPTIALLMHEAPMAGVTGRILREALADGGASKGTAQPLTMTSRLQLPTGTVTMRLMLSRYDGREYLDGSSVTHTPAAAVHRAAKH